MPLFFFISGCFFKVEYLNRPLQYVRKRLRRLWIPFIFLTTVVSVFHNEFFTLHLYGPLSESNTSAAVYPYVGNESILAVVNGLRFYCTEQLLSPLWFLPSLFYAGCASWCILRVRRFFHSRYIYAGSYLILAVAVTLFYLSGFVSRGLNAISGVNAFATLMFLLGYDIRPFIMRAEIYRRRWITLALIMLMSVALFFHQDIFGHGNLAIAFSWPLFLLTSLCGIYIIIGISRELLSTRLVRILCLIGNNSLAIMVLHLLCFKIVTLIIILFEGFGVEWLAQFPVLHRNISEWWTLVYISVGVIVPVLFNCCMKKMRVSIF